MNDGLEALPTTREALIDTARQLCRLGAQVCASMGGEVVADGAIGDATPGVPMTARSINLWLSSCKPVGAVAIGQLKDAGRLDFDATVATYWPEFGARGKDGITLRHILTHTGGIRTAEPADALSSRQEIAQAIAAAPVENGWVPGDRAGYHPTAGWNVLGEVIRRIDGRTYEDYVRAEILQPLGMFDSWATMTPEQAAGYGDRFSDLRELLDDALTVRPDYTVEARGPEAHPGDSMRGPANNLGRLYEMLLNLGDRDGVHILTPQTAAEITGPQRVGMYDRTFQHEMDWGLGVILDNKRYGPFSPYGFGPHASSRTFGHGGNQSSLGFGDPEHNLAVVVIFNGMPGDAKHDRRMKRVTAAIYEDLGLV